MAHPVTNGGRGSAAEGQEPCARILLVSESTDEREMYAAAFQLDGYSTLQAATAADACRLAAERPPTIVVTDVRLSGPEDGLTLARKLKGSKRMRCVPVVVLTSQTLAPDSEATLSRGFDLMLFKPCLPDALSAAVAELIERVPPH